MNQLWLKTVVSVLAFISIFNLTMGTEKDLQHEEVTVVRIIENVKAKAQSVKDMKSILIVTIRDPDNNRKETAKFELLLINPQPIRLTYIEPAMMADTVIILTGSTARVYNPFIGWTFEQDVSRFIKAQNIPFDLQRLFTLPTTEEYTPVLVSTERFSQAEAYVVEIKPKNTACSGYTGEFQRIWIDGADWLPFKVEFYDDKGALVGRLSLENMEVNSGITLDQVLQLPGDT